MGKRLFAGKQRRFRAEESKPSQPQTAFSTSGINHGRHSHMSEGFRGAIFPFQFVAQKQTNKKNKKQPEQEYRRPRTLRQEAAEMKRRVLQRGKAGDDKRQSCDEWL